MPNSKTTAPEAQGAEAVESVIPNDILQNLNLALFKRYDSARHRWRVVYINWISGSHSGVLVVVKVIDVFDPDDWYHVSLDFDGDDVLDLV